MEDRVLVGLLQSSRHINERLKSLLNDGCRNRCGVLAELNTPLRHLSQSLLVLISLHRTITPAVDNSAHWPSRLSETIVEHLYQLITTATWSPFTGVSPEPLCGTGRDSSVSLASPSRFPRAPSEPTARCVGDVGDEEEEAVMGERPSAACVWDTARTDAQTRPVPPQSPPATESWESEVYGCEEAIVALQHALLLPRRFPQLFVGRRARPWRRLLLYGPPGTGKTHLAHVAARLVDSPLISLSGADLLSKWVGESEKQVRHVFELAAQYGQCIVFLDELDALCGVRGASSETEASRRLKTEFLLQLQSLPANVTLLAATNLPWEIDPAMRRRFDRFVYVGLPTAKARRQLVQDRLAGIASALSSEQLAHVVDATALYATSDLIHVVDHAVLMPLSCLLTDTAVRLATESEEAAQARADAGADAAVSPTADEVHWPCFVPCAADDPRALPCLTPSSLLPDQLCVPPVTFAHFDAALKAYPPSTSETDVRRIQQWGHEAHNA